MADSLFIQPLLCLARFCSFQSVRCGRSGAGVVNGPGATVVAASVLFLATAFMTASAGFAATVSGDQIQWQPVNIDFSGPESVETGESPNPFLDYRLNVRLTSPTGNSYQVPGFFAGDGQGGGSGSIWRVRFSADEAGTWNYSADFRSGAGIAIDLSDNPGVTLSFHGDSGVFDVAERDPEASGFLKHGRLEHNGKHYLKFRDGPYWIKSGTDSPENFLGYAGFDNTTDSGGIESNFLHRYEAHFDDWNAETDPFFMSEESGADSRGIIGALNYLSGNGVNSIYFLPMNLGGDGQDTYPFLGPGNTTFNKTHYDISKLDQWDQVLDHAQRRGIASHFVLSETELANERWLDNGELGIERKLYFRELIARYAYLLAGKWNLGEESDFPVNFLTAAADYISALDWSNKPITVHTHNNVFSLYEEIVGDPRFSATSIQYTNTEAGQHVETWRQRSADTGAPWVIDMDENATGLTSENASTLRKQVLYDVYFSGGNIEWYFGYQPLPIGGDINAEDFRVREPMWRYMRIAREFMEAYLPFWDMVPADQLVNGEAGDFGGAEVFAKTGEAYAVYLPNASGQPGIDLTASENAMDMRWFDPATGNFEGETRVLAASQIHNLGTPPARDNDDWVVLLTRHDNLDAQEPEQQEPEPQDEQQNPEQQPVAEEEPDPAVILDDDPAPEVAETDADTTEESQTTDADSVSPDSVEDSVEDDLVEDTGTAENRAPQIEFVDDQQLVVDQSLSLVIRSVDPDGPVPALYLVTAPVGARLDDNGDGTRSLIWTPNTDDVGTHVVRVATADADDLSLTSDISFGIIVTQSIQVSDTTPVVPETIPVGDGRSNNQAPLIFIDNEYEVQVGQHLQLVAVPVDPEGRVPGLTIRSQGSGEAVPGMRFVDNLNGTRTIDWTPQPEDRGRHELALTAVDALDSSLTSERTLVLNVVPQQSATFTPELNIINSNYPPVFPLIEDRSVAVGEELRIVVAPIDPEGFAPILHVENAPAEASFPDRLDGSRELVWSPTEPGEVVMRFVAIDQQSPALSDTLTVRVQVRE